MPSKVIKRILSVILTLTILLSLCPPYAPVSAEPEYDGFCVHHPAHTAECGYGEAVKGQPCTHVHDESCGYAEAVEEIPCDMECPDVDGDGIADHVEGCAYQPATEASPCTHIHDETCGYVEASEASPCTYAVNGCPYCVVSWEWVDDQQLLTRLEDGWGMGLPGAGEDNPLTREAVVELLPGAITAMTHSGQEVTLEISWDLTALPEESIPDGDYSLTAALPEAYALTEEAEALSITLQIGGTETYTDTELQLPSGDPPPSEHIINGLSPNGTTIDLFDYWITNRTEPDDGSNMSDVDALVNQGINTDHALLFGKGMDDHATSQLGSWNVWTGKGEPPWTGIVEDELGDDGFPVLNLADQINNASKLIGRDGAESLAYLFDTSTRAGKAAYTDVRGLLQVDEAGYYYYDSTKNYAVFYEETNSFTLYKYPGVIPGGTSPVGQFFPFNAANADGESVEFKGERYNLMNTSLSTDASINHYFGMHMSTRFIQQDGGKIDENTPITYEFSGDDDIWIFIDGILVADLGGIHDSASVKINFHTGVIIINEGKKGEYHTTLKDKMGLLGATFEDNTYHTLDFFYLERGNTDSNMNLKYNLVTIPESDLIKVDQLGNPVPGAEFTLYATNDTGREPIATGTTDSRGEFVFLRKDGSGNEFPITITELYNKYKDRHDADGNNLILKETKTPPGYRSMGEIGLYFYKADKAKENEVLLLSNSTWDKGAYAMPKVTATTRNEISLLKLAAGDEVKETVTLVGDGAVENPLMFAVVFQKQSDGTWLPVSGDPLNGWTVHKDSSWTGVLEAAKKNRYIFQIGSSGAYQVEIDNLPGDIKTYYYICNNKEAAKYTIAYYYTKADSLDDATEKDTWRIADKNPANPLDRAFAMSLYVSNVKNRLLVQKVDEGDNPITGATFCLYEKEDVTIGQDGIVTVNSGATPYDSLVTRPIDDILKLDGGGIFPTAGKVLKLGEYYLVETEPPYGYVANSTPVHIVVDNTGVYANAGTTEDDGITVLRGVGSVMRSMVQFAADDDVNTTLQGIQAVLANNLQFDTYKVDGSFSWDAASSWQPGKDVLHLQYANENKMLDYGLYDDSVGTLGNLTLPTEIGWSKLLIRQCYKHDNTVDTSLKTPLDNEDITNLFSGTVTVRVTNVRKIVNVTIEKEVTGNLGDHTKQFAFKVQSSLPMEAGNNYKLYDKGKTATFSLAHNQSVTLKVPVGAYLKIEEVAGGYEKTIWKPDGTILTGDYLVTDANTQTITVTNHKNVVIDTGIVLDALPYVVLLGIVAVGAILLLRRRRRRE